MSRWRWATGLPAIALAVLLYVAAILYEPDFEPLLVVGVLILLPIGIYLSSMRQTPDPKPEDHPDSVRLAGPGRPDSEERKRWVQVQSQRASMLRKVVLAVFLTALGMFVQNHVRGSIDWGIFSQVKKTWNSVRGRESGTAEQSARKSDSKGLRWETQADWWESYLDYRTRKGDTLTRIGLANGLAPSEIGARNPAAKLRFKESLLKSTLNAEHNVKTAGEITLDAVALANEATPAEIAAGFSTVELAAGQSLMIPKERPYDPRQWVDWLLWALVGIAAYLLIEITRNVRDLVSGEGDFIRETNWYWTQLLTGPLIAFVIILLFTHIDVDLLAGDEAAVEVNLNRYPIDLLIVPAFLLGFYSRVAREVLDQITRAVFRSAWMAANGVYEVLIKGQEDDEVATEVIFETKPPTSVVWSSTAGTITSGGIFQPPTVEEPKQVYITAVAAGSGRAVTKAVTVVKHKFEIKALGNEAGILKPGQEQVLEMTPEPKQNPEKVSWELVDPPSGVSFVGQPAGPKVSIQVAATAVIGREFKVKAKYAGLSRMKSFTIAAAGVMQIKAKASGMDLKQGDEVAAGTKVDFEIAGLDDEQAKAAAWSADPASLLTFSTAQTGKQVSGTVGTPAAGGQELTVKAKHPEKGEATLKLGVKGQ